MYEVNLRVDPNRLLDWDAPLAQQPAVRDAAFRDPMLGQGLPQYFENNQRAFPAPTGGQMHDALKLMGFTPEQIASRLREAGVPGIRYLDGSSRAAGEGTRNVVMFDDSLVDIVRRYGLAGLLAGGGAAAASGGAEAAAP